MEEIRCSVCGSVINAGDAFCQNCGSPVTAPAEGTQTGAAGTSEPQETTVLSANPYSLNNEDAGTPAQNETVESNTAGTASAGTYQQPNTSMAGTYQGSYNATYTQTTAEPVSTAPKGLGIAGLVCGIIGLVTGCCYGGFIFGLIGLILSIIYMVKKGSKGIGIGGIITSALGLIFSIVMLVLLLAAPSMIYNMMPDEYKYLIEDEVSTSSYDWDINTEDYDSSTTESRDTENGNSVSALTNANQVLVNDTTYTLPVNIGSLGMTVNPDYNSDEVAAVESTGVAPGSYIFALVNAADGTSFWGYIENTGSETVYSTAELSLTGINVDSYSEGCTANYVEAFGGIHLGMTRSEVESLIGVADQLDGSMDVYEADTGEVLRLEYDGDEVVAVDVTVYVE